MDGVKKSYRFKRKIYVGKIHLLDVNDKTVVLKSNLSTSPFNEHLVSFLEPGGVSRWAHS